MMSGVTRLVSQQAVKPSCRHGQGGPSQIRLTARGGDYDTRVAHRSARSGARLPRAKPRRLCNVRRREPAGAAGHDHVLAGTHADGSPVTLAVEGRNAGHRADRRAPPTTGAPADRGDFEDAIG